MRTRPENDQRRQNAARGNKAQPGSGARPVRRARNTSDFLGKATDRASVQRGRIELVLDALVMIEPLDGAVELGAFLLGELGFHLGDRLGKAGTIELIERR